MSTQLSSRTWPIRSVQVQLGSVAHPKSEPPLRAASWSQDDPEHRRANINAPRTTPLTMKTLAAHGEDSLQRLRRRVEASIARSACPASSSTILGGRPEEQEDLRRRMDEFMLHEEYHKSTVGEDGEIPLDAFRSPPQTEMGSFLYSGPSTDMADTVSLQRGPRVHKHPRAWHPDLPTNSRAPEKSLDHLHPEPTYGALDRTAELLAKLLSGSEDPDVTALSEAVKQNWVSPNPYSSQHYSQLHPDGARWLKISKDQGCPGCYPRPLAPALFILAPGQSQLVNYRTCR